MKQVAFFIIAVALIAPSLQAQKNTAGTAGAGLSGTWQSVDENGYATVLKLTPTGEGEYNGDPITYKLAGAKLKMEVSGTTVEYQYILKGKKLTLSGGDLPAALVFSRTAVSAESSENRAEESAPAQSIVGTWYGPGQVVIFSADGTMTLNGTKMSWTVAGNILFVQAPNAANQYSFEVTDKGLSIAIGDRLVDYSRTPSGGGAAKGSKTPAAGGVIALELAGRWCRVNLKSGNLVGAQSAGTQSAGCITVNENGTYEFSADTAVTVSATAAKGQKYDRGTWRLDDDVLLVASELDGFKTRKLQKQNHPRTGKPMLVIDGESFLATFEKDPW
jgi:hypothetical protein